MKNNSITLNLKSTLSAALFLLLFSYGCNRKETAVSSSSEIQRQRSLELEAYHQAPQKEVEQNSDASANTQSAVAPETPADRVGQIKSGQPTQTTTENITLSSKAQKKAEKLNKKLDKQSIKLKHLLEKKNELNSNLKLGIILILVGILIAVILGTLVNGQIFGAIGAIIAVIGIVFLILGLLEM